MADGGRSPWFRLSTARAAEAGTTLIELLVVLLIVAILLAVALPVFAGPSAAASQRQGQQDLDGAARAAQAYFDAAGSFDPNPGANPTADLAGALSTQEPAFTWLAHNSCGSRPTCASTSDRTVSLWTPAGPPVDTQLAVLAVLGPDQTCWFAELNESTGGDTDGVPRLTGSPGVWYATGPPGSACLAQTNDFPTGGPAAWHTGFS